jgi:hypothetical protein
VRPGKVICGGVRSDRSPADFPGYSGFMVVEAIERTVLLDFIKVGCKIVRHANQLFQKFGKNCHNFFIMKKIYARC